jgi:ABC-type phosphate transport system substrate-binding protein
MKIIFAIATVVMLLWAATSSTDASPGATREFVVIVNKQNPLSELSTVKLRTVFLRRISRWPWGAEIQPVDLSDGSALRRNFAREVLDSTLAQLEIYWIDQKQTRNINPPAVAPSVEAAKSTVAAYPGAIGYIPALAVDGRVKTLELVP